MRILYLTLLLCLSLAVNAQTDYRGPGIIYGDNHAFTLYAPLGWVLDNKSAADQGIYAVFYPKYETWADAATVMYANTSGYEKGQNIDSIIAFDLGRFIAVKPDIDIRKMPDQELPNNKTAIIRHIYGDDNGNEEAIAYIAEPKPAVISVMTSWTEIDFEKNLPRFNELLESYEFLTDDDKAIKKMVKEFGGK